MKHKPEKHLPYFTVLEAFQKAKGCAMCELEAAATRRYPDSLLIRVRERSWRAREPRAFKGLLPAGVAGAADDDASAMK